MEDNTNRQGGINRLLAFQYASIFLTCHEREIDYMYSQAVFHFRTTWSSTVNKTHKITQSKEDFLYNLDVKYFNLRDTLLNYFLQWEKIKRDKLNVISNKTIEELEKEYECSTIGTIVCTMEKEYKKIVFNEKDFNGNYWNDTPLNEKEKQEIQELRAKLSITEENLNNALKKNDDIKEIKEMLQPSLEKENATISNITKMAGFTPPIIIPAKLNGENIKINGKQAFYPNGENFTAENTRKATGLTGQIWKKIAEYKVIIEQIDKTGTPKAMGNYELSYYSTNHKRKTQSKPNQKPIKKN